MHAAQSPEEEVQRHVEPLKELALRTPAGINAVAFKTGKEKKYVWKPISAGVMGAIMKNCVQIIT